MSSSLSPTSHVTILLPFVMKDEVLSAGSPTDGVGPFLYTHPFSSSLQFAQMQLWYQSMLSSLADYNSFAQISAEEAISVPDVTEKTPEVVAIGSVFDSPMQQRVREELGSEIVGDSSSVSCDPPVQSYKKSLLKRYIGRSVCSLFGVR